MPNNKYLPICLDNQEEGIKRLTEVVTLFEIKGGAPSLILEESGLKALAKSGVLDFANCSMQELEKLDLYAINTCLRVLRKEQMIRQEYNPLFNVDRLPYLYLDTIATSFECQGEPKVHELLEKRTEGVFLVERGLNLKDCPPCYKYLAYQTAYLLHYYPGLDTYIDHFHQEDELFDSVHSMGIYVESYATHGAYIKEDNSVGLIPKSSSQREVFPKVNYAFDGFGDILNAGVAASEMGISISNLKQAFEGITGNEVKAVVISLPTLAPNETRIRSAMRKRLHSEDKNSKEYREAKIYEELELEGAGTREIVQKAAELADVSRVEIVPKALCIYAAYENWTKKAILRENEWGLILDWNDQSVCVSVLQRKFGQLMINWQEIKRNPLLDVETELEPTAENLLPQFKRIEKLMRMMFQSIQIQSYEISKVYLAGEWCNFSFILSWMENFMGSCTECFAIQDVGYAAVKGAAYLAAKKRID